MRRVGSVVEGDARQLTTSYSHPTTLSIAKARTIASRACQQRQTANGFVEPYHCQTLHS